MPGRPPTFKVQMNEQTRAMLLHWQQRRKIPVGLARRGRAMLLLEQGYSSTQTSERVGLTPCHLRKWTKRFMEQGLSGLYERPRPGRPAVFQPEVALYIVKLACERPDRFGRSLSQWDGPELARKLEADGIVEHISPKTVRRILHSQKLKPWRHHLWQSAKVPRDEHFALVVRRLVDLYTRPLVKGEVVLCLDEKTNLQPRPRLAATKPARPGLPTRLEHEYKRGGALHLFAAFDTRTGKVYARTEPRKRQVELIAFLSQLQQELPPSTTRIFLVLDNVSMHKGKLVQAWLATHPHFVCHFTPVHCSWMNQVEQWFSIVQRKRLGFSDFSSVDHLAERLLAFVAEWNTHAHPFNWSTKSATKVLAKCGTQPLHASAS